MRVCMYVSEGVYVCECEGVWVCECASGCVYV